MVYYRDFDYDRIQGKPIHKTNKKLYDDNIYTFDIETTSVFQNGYNVITFDKNIRPEQYAEFEKKGYMYIWQFGINEDVVYGRTWVEFTEFMSALRDNIAGYKIIYVHNLAFESHFLLNVIDDFEIFARAPRHAIVARSEEYKVEFRCSYVLTNAALAKVPKMYNLPCEKKVGDLDYNVLRNYLTPLDEKEMGYCEEDCKIVYFLIKQIKEQYQYVHNIPLTQTGFLRRDCQKMYIKDYDFKKWLKKQLSPNIDILSYILKAFAGGYTHANAYYTGDVIKNVHSKDITSSYPTVMIAERFPVGPWVATRKKQWSDFNTEKYCYVLDVTFYRIYSRLQNNYISFSKCQDYSNPVIDNGRIASAEMVRMIVTNADIDIIRAAYNFESYEINSCMESEAGYLDHKFMQKIIVLYHNKTAFKNLPEKEQNYRQSKQYINACYGMAVTNLIRDEVVFQSKEWSTKIMTHDDAQKKLEKINGDRKTFLNQAWGVFVTAYARRNLWTVLMQIDKDAIYCDTDSIKYIGDHETEFNAYNQLVTTKLQESCKINDLNADQINPADTFGKKHPLGVFDTEEDYAEFITLGAKKYAFRHKGKPIEITVSGVSKSGAKALKKLSDFKQGFTFDYEHCGKKLLTYNDQQTETTITDRYGNAVKYTEQYGINLMATEYTIGTSEDYEEYINNTLHYSEGGF